MQVIGEKNVQKYTNILTFILNIFYFDTYCVVFLLGYECYSDVYNQGKFSALHFTCHQFNNINEMFGRFIQAIIIFD
jgi:hypothetical protein